MRRVNTGADQSPPEISPYGVGQDLAHSFLLACRSYRCVSRAVRVLQSTSLRGLDMFNVAFALLHSLPEPRSECSHADCNALERSLCILETRLSEKGVLQAPLGSHTPPSSLENLPARSQSCPESG